MIFGYMYGVYCTENVADDNTSSGEEELEVRLRWLVFLSTAEHLTYAVLTHITHTYPTFTLRSNFRQ